MIIEATSPSSTSSKTFPKSRSSPVWEALVAVCGLLGVGTREVLQPLNKEILVLLQQQKLPKDHVSLKILIPQDRPHVLFRLYRQHEPCQIPCPQASFPARHQFQLGRSPKHCWFDHEQNRLPKYSVMILNTSFSPMGSATKFLCFCEVVDILRMVLWCLECSAKGRHHTDICAKRSHTG